MCQFLLGKVQQERTAKALEQLTSSDVSIPLR